MSNIAIILLALSWVWLFLFDRAETCSRVARDWIYALTLVATLWLLALTLIPGPPLLMALLALPCVPVFVIAALQASGRAWQALGLFTRNRKAA